MSAWPVEALPCFGVACGLAVFGVPLGAVVDPFAFAVSVECAVAASVDEAFGWLGFVSSDVVGFEWCAVEVFGRVAVHGACAVFAFCAVYVVVDEVAAWDFVLGVSVAALLGGFLFGLDLEVFGLHFPSFGFQLLCEPFAGGDAAVSTCAAHDADSGGALCLDRVEVVGQCVGDAWLFE